MAVIFIVRSIKPGRLASSLIQSLCLWLFQRIHWTTVSVLVDSKGNKKTAYWYFFPCTVATSIWGIHVKSPGFARSLPVFYYISWSPGGSSKSPGFQWNPNKQILPNFPNWMWIIGFISGWVLSIVFFCVTSLWQCQLTNSGNCNRLWDWANLMLTTVTTSKYKQRHRRLGQQIEQWPELELFKSHLPLMTEHWKQSNKYLGAMPTPCLLLTLFISFMGASRTAPIPYYRPSYTFRSKAQSVHIYTNNAHPYIYTTCACFKVYIIFVKHYYLSILVN